MSEAPTAGPGGLGQANGSAMRVAVVGASSGLGRCIGIGLADRGAHVALLARRRDRLQKAAKEAGHGAVPVVCDVTEESSCRQAIAAAVDALGGLDALVYSTGIGIMAPLADTDASMWTRLFATNVVGAALITAAAVPQLEASAGAAVYISSLSASMTPPWPMLGGYAVSKAALDKLVEAWRGEHPGIAFTRLAVGDSYGGKGDSQTEFPATWDPAMLSKAIEKWFAAGYMNGGLVGPEDLTDTVEFLLRRGDGGFIPYLTLSPRPPARQNAGEG